MNQPIAPTLPPLLAELYAAAEARKVTPTNQPLPTLKQLEERDFRSLVAGGWVLV